MKSSRNILMAVSGALALSVASCGGQVLNLSGLTLEGSLTNQTLINSGNGLSDGTVSTWVFNGSSAGSSDYIFVYQLENSSASPDQITGASFSSFVTSLGVSQYAGSLLYSNVTGGSLPGSLPVTVSLDPNFSFSTVTGGGAASYVLFGNDVGLDKGTTSWFIAIDTDSTSITSGYGLTIDDFQAYGQILAPDFATSPVPEPSSAILLLAGFACFYGILRCRRAMD